jgi:enoyl-[acyl-carrier-protein] reductase (NADH)
MYKTMCETIPIGRFAEAIEIGALAAYLASDASDAMTGTILTIDGGYGLQH